MKTSSLLSFATALALTAPLHATLPPGKGETQPLPVIDVHTHVFNVRDLPLQGILLSRIFEQSKATRAGALSEAQAIRVADALTSALLRNAEFESLALPPAEAATRFPLWKLASDAPAPATTQAVTLTPEERAAFASLLGLPALTWQGDFSRQSADETKSATPEKLRALPDDFSRLAQAAEIVGFLQDDDHVDDEHSTQLQNKSLLLPSLFNYPRFLLLMMQRRDSIATTLAKSYRPGDLFVAHLMDMARAYADQPKVSFEDQQQREMPSLTRTFKGKLAYFTAVDPFRDDQALPTVVAGIKAGAIGVKIYPASGYTVVNNKFPPRPGNLGGAGQRWDSRYTGRTEEDVNRTLDAFFAYAEREKIPIFAHCSSKGFEARAGYGLNAHPKHWAKVLETYPDLILCFGHAGGHQFWFSDPATPDAPPSSYKPEDAAAWEFGRQVVDLCRQRRNVYCEVGYLEKILTRKGAAAFAKRLAHELAQPPPPGGFPLGQKIMYGTDWHMLYQESNWDDYLAACDRVISEIENGKWRADFFSGNAIRYLRLAELATDTRFDQAQRDHWKAIVGRTLK